MEFIVRPNGNPMFDKVFDNINDANEEFIALNKIVSKVQLIGPGNRILNET